MVVDAMGIKEKKKEMVLRFSSKLLWKNNLKESINYSFLILYSQTPHSGKEENGIRIFFTLQWQLHRMWEPEKSLEFSSKLSFYILSNRGPGRLEDRAESRDSVRIRLRTHVFTESFLKQGCGGSLARDGNMEPYGSFSLVFDLLIMCVSKGGNIRDKRAKRWRGESARFGVKKAQVWILHLYWPTWLWRVTYLLQPQYNHL